jgi:hypothetical protein
MNKLAELGEKALGYLGKSAMKNIQESITKDGLNEFGDILSAFKDFKNFKDGDGNNNVFGVIDQLVKLVDGDNSVDTYNQNKTTQIVETYVPKYINKNECEYCVHTKDENWSKAYCGKCGAPYRFNQ